jgi:hypothetical protein
MIWEAYVGKVRLSLPKRERRGEGGAQSHQLYIMAFHVIFLYGRPDGGWGALMGNGPL